MVRSVQAGSLGSQSPCTEQAERAPEEPGAGGAQQSVPEVRDQQPPLAPDLLQRHSSLFWQLPMFCATRHKHMPQETAETVTDVLV